MRDVWWQRAVKAVVRASILAELRLRRRLRPPTYRLGGDCRSCGECCEAPTVQADKLTWYFPRLRRAFLWWQRVVNGFELVGTEKPRLFVFRCTHFDPATRRCDSYDSRPAMCRDYPRALLDQPWPELLPGCGHRPIARNAEGMLVKLRTSGLSEAQQAELRRKLRLE